MKKSSLRVLRPEEFDADWLEYLTLEGRVYVDAPIETDAEAFKREVLDYVASIRDFVAEDWTDRIDGLWQEIVEADCMSDVLTMKYGTQGGHMNRYMVTNIVGRMQNFGVYRQDVPMVVLHKRMERTTEKNRYYKGFSSYDISRQAAKFLRNLFSKDKNW